MYTFISRLHFSSHILLILFFFMLAACTPEKQTPPVKIGDSARPFTLQDLDGNTISLSDYSGSPVVLRFILTDCKFCRADTPKFNDYYAKYADQGLRILYIDSLGVDPSVLNIFVKELAITFPVVQDIDGKVAAKYKVRALPQTIILSPDHKIIAAILGGVGEPELDKWLSPYFN